MTVVLATKFFEPQVPKTLVVRPRLVEQLSQGLTSRITLVSAPAGYGKSTLLSEWRASPEGAATRLAWISVDEADNDPVRFWVHVSAALQRVQPGLGQSLADWLERPALSALGDVLQDLVNELATLGEPLVMVLDDLHAVSAREVFESLGFVVTHLPPQVRLVVATRTDPPLPLAALRARGELAELRVPLLRFTPDEVASYFQRQGIELDPDVVQLLATRTEGWAAGVHLASLTLAGHDDRAAFIRNFAGDDRSIVDFLVDEVLARQPDEVQEFLLSTSVLERMSSRLCDAVTNSPGSEAMLRRLEAANLFIVPLDNTRTWFRYHHLFAELLRRELGTRRPGLESDLHERAARWLRAEGLVDEAVPHAVAAGAWDLVIDIGTTHGLRLFLQGRSSSFRRLYGTPDEELRKRPEAALGFAWLAVLSGDLRQAQRWLELAEETNRADPDTPIGPRLDSELLWALLDDRRGDIGSHLSHVDRVMELLADHPELAGLDRAARLTRAVLFRARATMWNGDLAAAAHLIDEADDIQREHQPARTVIEALGLRALLAVWDGHAGDAQRHASEALTLAGEQQLDDAANVAWAHVALGINHLARLELDDARHHLTRARDVLQTHGDLNGSRLVACVFADWLRLTGLPHDSVSTLRSMRQERFGDQPPPPLVVEHVARSEALARLAAGDVVGAANLFADDTMALPAIQARVELARDRPAVAAQLAERALAAGVVPGRFTDRLDALTTAAIARDGAGDRRRALESLAEAIRAAAPAGWVAPFTELGSPIRLLAEKLPPDVNLIASAFRRKVLDTFAGGRPPESGSGALLVEALSERELAVLRRLPSSLSNQEIASLLYVSLNTIKTQLRSVYRKLGVNSRHEAIERARQLGLL